MAAGSSRVDRARVDRARAHAALGDPVRLAIVEDLALSDRSPSELGRRHGVASNLLAHHLDVLEEAGLIMRGASSGDARRRYVRLIGERLAGVVALPTSALPERATVFLCTHNSARSQLAAALWERRTGLPARSAGTHPAPEVHRLAVEAGTRHGLDLHGARPQALDAAGTLTIDARVITVCDSVHEDLDVGPDWWHWSIPDPVPVGTSAAFDAVVEELEARIGRVVPAVSISGPATDPPSSDRSPS